MSDDNYINGDLKNISNNNKSIFAKNNPFPHISLENFFDNKYLSEIMEEFPDLDKMGCLEFKTNTDKRKFATDVGFKYPTKIRNFISFLNSSEFLNFLQDLTGIKEKLVPDPYFFGGGLHQIKKGGFLKIHADFNYHPQMKLDRRINVLIYLNQNWKKEYGGYLELWDKEMKKCVKKILPTFNKIIIFNTNDYTFHGHPDPLDCPENISRKSIALYYYSNGRPSNEINHNRRFHNTIYKNRINSLDKIDERLPEFKKIFGKIYLRHKTKT